MAFEFGGGSLNPGQTTRLFYQLGDYKYSGAQVLQARALTPGAFLITDDVAHELRSGRPGGLYVYSVSVKNVGSVAALFNIVGGGVN